MKGAVITALNMDESLLLGLDLGTTNAKAAVYDRQGRLVAESSAAYATHYPQPGWAEQRPADWLRALTTACRQLMHQLGPRRQELVGIGLAAHGPGLVLVVDRQGQPLLDTSPTPGRILAVWRKPNTCWPLQAPIQPVWACPIIHFWPSCFGYANTTLALPAAPTSLSA